MKKLSSFLCGLAVLGMMFTSCDPDDPKTPIENIGNNLKKDKSVFEKAKKTNILGKYLEVEIKDDVYKELDELLK